MRYLTVVVAVCASFALAACESMSPANYSNSADNSMALRAYADVKVSVSSMTDESKFDSGCRLVGPITASGKRSVQQFVLDSFNEEFKFANIYSQDDSAAKLSLVIVSAAFSSSEGLTKGWWDFTVKLENPANGRSLTVSSKYDFQSGFSAVAACQNSSLALTPAVQLLINKVVTDPGFRDLVSR